MCISTTSFLMSSPSLNCTTLTEFWRAVLHFGSGLKELDQHRSHRLISDIACDDVGVVPGDISQGAGDHVLRDAVKDVSHTSCPIGPRGSHFLERLAPEEHRAGLTKRAHDFLPDFLIHV